MSDRLDLPPTDPGSSPLASRRRFLALMAGVAIGGRVWLRTGSAQAAVDAARLHARGEIEWPAMSHRVLGRTGFRASRLVFGCGAALSRQPREELLEAAFEAGINVFDVGYRGYYRDAEANLAPFLRRHRDQVLLVSKAMVSREIEPGQKLGAAERQQAAALWAERLDASLRELRVDRVDAYYLMAANNVDLVESDELRAAFERAKQAGKVEHLGLSSHQNTEAVLEAAARTGAYGLAQIAITPAGWYDLPSRGVLEGSRPMLALRPVLDRARAAGIGLIGMKAARYLAGRRILGWSQPEAFDAHYDAAFLRSGLNGFQRSYAYVLGHGLDAVNADMQSLDHLQQNLAATATAARVFA